MTGVSVAAPEERLLHGMVNGRLAMWWFLASEIMVFGGLVGVFILFRALRSWRQVSIQAEPVQPVQPEDPYIVRLEEELRGRDV